MIALRRAVSTSSVQAALGLLLGSTILAATALARGIQLEPLPSPAAATLFTVATRQANAGTPMDMIDGAVAAAPFAPTREPGSGRTARPAASETQVLPPQLIGTVVDAEGDSFVLVGAPGEPAHVVRVGQTVSGHRLLSIEQGAAVFIRNVDGQRVTLRVPRSR